MGLSDLSQRLRIMSLDSVRLYASFQIGHHSFWRAEAIIKVCVCSLHPMLISFIHRYALKNLTIPKYKEVEVCCLWKNRENVSGMCFTSQVLLTLLFVNKGYGVLDAFLWNESTGICLKQCGLLGKGNILDDQFFVRKPFIGAFKIKKMQACKTADRCLNPLGSWLVICADKCTS